MQFLTTVQDSRLRFKINIDIEFLLLQVFSRSEVLFRSITENYFVGLWSNFVKCKRDFVFLHSVYDIRLFLPRLGLAKKGFSNLSAWWYLLFSKKIWAGERRHSFNLQSRYKSVISSLLYENCHLEFWLKSDNNHFPGRSLYNCGFQINKPCHKFI